jgi:hypothetical protein
MHFIMRDETYFTDIAMKNLMKIVILLIAVPSFSGYTGNHTSKVSWVKIYNNDAVYFATDKMPSDHQCGNNFFTLSTSLSEKQRDRYFSMLLTAKASGATISVGYDKINPDCQSNRVVVHAISYN